MKLSDTQLILLSEAAKRDDRAVNLRSDIEAAAAERLVSKLAGAGLIEEIEASGVLPVWRRVDDVAFALRITDAGLRAIGVDDVVTTSHPKQAVRKTSAKLDKAVIKPRRTTKPSASPKTSKPKVPKKPQKSHAAAASTRGNGTKHNQILGLLRCKQGASLEEMQKISGWQLHSIRGFLSGTVKKRLGLKLQSSLSKEGARRYSVAG